jgi:hypothetical protein
MGGYFTKLSYIHTKAHKIIEEHVLDTNAGKQLSSAATDVKLTLVLKN